MLPVFLPMLRTLLTGHSVHSVQDPPLVPPQGTHHQKPRSRSFPYSSWKWAIQLSTLAHRPPRGSEIAGCLVRGSEVWFWLVFDVFFKWNLFYIPPKKLGGGKWWKLWLWRAYRLAQSPASEFCKLSPLTLLGDLRAVIHHLRGLGLIIQVKMQCHRLPSGVEKRGWTGNPLGYF